MCGVIAKYIIVIEIKLKVVDEKNCFVLFGSLNCNREIIVGTITVGGSIGILIAIIMIEVCPGK